MRNTWIIFKKELRSYFVSPVAYLLLAMFAVVFGFFFWNILGFFIYRGMESQMRGSMYPMNVNEEVIRPLLSNVSVIGLFLIPMITMRLFAEEKRTGTIELLATSPIRDGEVIVGKWLASLRWRSEVRMEFLKARQTKYAAYAATYIAVVLAILTAGNVLANRYDKSFDATSNKRYSLSDQTAKIVKGLRQDATITYFDQTSRFQSAKDQLDLYANLSPKVHVEYVDPDKKPQLAREAGIKNYGTTVVQIGTN